MLIRETLIPFCGIAFVFLLIAPQAPAQTIQFDHVTSVSPLTNGMELHDGAATIRITALRDDVIRIRASRTATLPEDASWAVLPAARKASVDVIQDGNTQNAGFHTKKLRIVMDRRTGLLTLRNDHGEVLQQETVPLQFEGDGFHLTDAMPLDEHYFGLGDKTGAFDRRNEAFRLWNTDSYSWQESTDPLYKSVPFYLTYRAGVSLGVLIDNTWPCSFDFGKTRGNTFQYRADNGPANIYLMYGPSAKRVLASYAWLTGPTTLPPLWALGFQQSRYSYMTQARVLQIADRLRADKIPADGIYLDIDYQYKDRPFAINTTTFPDMAGLIAKLHQEQFHLVAITDPHIADVSTNGAGQGYAPFLSGVAGNHFVKNPDGSLYVGTVWPGPSVFPDFTQQGTRAWWGTLYQHFDKIGVDGFWNDMDEPSVFNAIGTMPDDVVFHIDEPGFVKRTVTQREVHNIYGMENSRATYDSQLKLRPNVRPFVLTRATYAGGQRYAATWTGDNSATWNHLRLTTPMLKNLGLSGFSFAGADIGGYAGTPSAELLTKWIEIAAFQPLYRDHAEKGTGPHEPWANGPVQEDIRRRFIDARYRLLPYLYTVMEHNTHTGLPLLRPVFLEFPDAAADRHPIDLDPQAAGEFMVGPDLLVAAAPFPDKLDDYNAELPSHGWYDYWTGQRVEEGHTHVPGVGLQPESETGAELTSIRIHPDITKLPVFVRPGTILPVEPLVQNTEQKPQGALMLRVFPGPQCHGELYQDDGSSFDYVHGDFLRMNFSCELGTGHHLKIHIGKHVGPYPAWWGQITVEVNGLEKATSTVSVNGQPETFVRGDHSITVTVDDTGNGVEIDIPGVS